ncbi:MAG: SIS domain-containing protein [Oscillospiraceae bacterium]|nr:SIS domain-containing protein [Oscillospiraceae bacterium]
MGNDILAKIQAQMSELSKGQKLIANYILEYYDKAAFMTASKMGKTVGVSESTVVRFAVELGFDGYPAMQKALQEMVLNKLTSVQRIEVANDRFGNQDVIATVLQQDVDKIRATMESVNRAAFHRAVDAIINARRIYILGVRSSATIAFFMNFYFNYMFENVRMVNASSPSEVVEQLASIEQNDVVITISYPRYSRSAVQATEYCKSTGAKVVAITDNRRSPVAKYADFLLTAKMDITGRVAKFVDCRSKDVSEREIFIVEGDSALGSVKTARDPNYQAVMPIRGKILNCLKADYDKIFKNEIITDLIKVLGCGVQVKTKANKSIGAFDLNALRWSKVILCTDADVDGFHIRTMLLTMIYRLMPDLIDAGKVFIAESPLYEITAKDKTYFAYNEREKEQFLSELQGQRFTIQRSKGLGENDPDMMNLTTMKPKTRRLIQVNPGDVESTAAMFDILLGDNLNGRKDYISEHGSEYMDDLDVS